MILSLFLQSGPAFEISQTHEANFQYDLTVVTGVWKESGTDSNVAIVIHGKASQSQPIVLSKHQLESRTILARGSEDSVVLNLPMSLGTVQYIHVWHDNSGSNPSWFLSHITLKDRLTGKKWMFLSNSWFALEKGDGKIDRILIPLSEREMKSFAYSLTSRRSQSFAEGHLWLSVVTKPPKSEFTRVQRATCCLCLMMSAMLANAMFYQSNKVADPTIQIGPLKFSWRQIVVGIQSALIVTPVNLLIMLIFKNSARKVAGKADSKKTESSQVSLTQRRTYSFPRCPENPVGTRDGSAQKQTSLSTRPFQRLRIGRLKHFKFPHFCSYIACFLSFTVVSASFTITVFYSLQWGKEIADQWISSMLVSLTEDLFILQPVKICLVMVLTAYLFRGNDSENIGYQTTTDQQTCVAETGDTDKQDVKVEILHGDELMYAKEYKIKEAKMFSFGKELLFYLFFLLLLTIVCYGNRSYHGYTMTKNLKDTFSNFSLVSNRVTHTR